MQENLHYSDKGGYLKRSVVSRSIADADKKGFFLPKSELSFCGRRYSRRITVSGRVRR